MGTRRSLPTLVGILIALSSLPLAASVSAASTDLYFSEYVEGSSNNKALEIYNGTGAPVSLTGYSLQFFFNGSPNAGTTINLSGTVQDGDVFVVADDSAAPGIVAVANQLSTSNFFNGDDAIVLRKGSTIIDSIGQVDEDPGSEWGTGNTSTADNTLSRKATVTDGDTNATDAFDPSVEWDGFPTNTFDGLGRRLTEAWPAPGECSDSQTPISRIQGSGASSPLYRDRVVTEGVVVADFEGPAATALDGFFIQSTAGDGDRTTSDGLFVYTGTATDQVSVGAVVRVAGTVGELFGDTQLLANSIVDCEATASVAPVDLRLPDAYVSGGLERYEGMLVRFPETLVIAEYFNYDRFGEIVLAEPLESAAGRPMTPTSVVEPGAPAQARLNANRLRRITLDDGVSAQNPTTLRHPNGDAFSLENRFRGGDTVKNAVGALSGSFGYKIQPTAPAVYNATNPRPTAPDNVGGTVQVAAFNMLNYFLTLDPSGGPLDNKCGPTQTVECRGADNIDEFNRQRAKLLAALEGLDADIVGVNEIENTPGVEPLADISAGLNNVLGAGTFHYIDTGVIGPDVIRVGLLYTPGTVTPVGGWEVLTSDDNPRFDETLSRPALAQTFEENATGEQFTVVVNHLKSKGSACDGDPDTGDGQGNCNVTRTLAAQAMVDWLATDPTGSGDPDFLITGDLNAYALEDPIDAVQAGADDKPDTADDYTNLIRRFEGEFAYSYVFDGMSGYLDHAIANRSLLPQVTGATVWHINADEPDVLDYDTSFKPDNVDDIYAEDQYRSSDHDPVIVGLQLASGD